MQSHANVSPSMQLFKCGLELCRESLCKDSRVSDHGLNEAPVARAGVSWGTVHPDALYSRALGGDPALSYMSNIRYFASF